MKVWKTLTIVVFLALVLVLSSCFLAFRAGRDNARPYPIRVLSRHRPAIIEFVKQIENGDVVERSDGQGYIVPTFLAKENVRYIRDREGTVIFTFGIFLPPDEVEELVYSPKGFKGLPETQLCNEFNKKIVRFEYIEEHWFYWARN